MTLAEKNPAIGGTFLSPDGNTGQMFTGRFRQFSSLTTLSDSGLSQRARKGDAEAFSEIYRRRSRQVYRFSLQMSGSQETAEEVTQEVFLALLRDELSFDDAKGTLESFLLGVARNLVRRRYREPPAEVLVESETPAAPEPGVLEDLTRRESLALLHQAVSSLPESYREVVVLCELEELSYEEAAAVMGCPLGTVRSRLARARALLAKKLLAGSPATGKVTSGCVA